jgi:hypothetical protein
MKAITNPTPFFHSDKPMFSLKVANSFFENTKNDPVYSDMENMFKAIATLSMFNSGEVRRSGFMNSQTVWLEAVSDSVYLSKE